MQRLMAARHASSCGVAACPPPEALSAQPPDSQLADFHGAEKRRKTRAKATAGGGGATCVFMAIIQILHARPGAKCMVSGDSFVKADPSLPLRISLGGSDAARTAQDVP